MLGPEALGLTPPKRVVQAQRNTRRLSLLDWTMQYRSLLIPGRRLDFRRHAYLIDIYSCAANEAIFCKAAQMGLSEYLISWEIHGCDQRDATALHVFPTDKHVSDFSAARLGPAIDASLYLQSIVVAGTSPGGIKGADRITLKRFRDRFLYFRGAKVDPKGMANQLKSIDADLLGIDEVDEMDPRAPIIAEKRLGHSAIAERRRVSTPTFPGHGIDVDWRRSDQREWHIKCQACGKLQFMTIHGAVTEWDELERPTEWHGREEGRAWIACEKCGREINRLAAGEWVALQPASDVAGFHLTKLFSPLSSLDAIIANLQQLDETKRREAFNQDLGLPYRPRGGGLTDADIEKCRREYGHGAVADEVVYMGVDVGSLLHVVIRAAPDAETGERRQRLATITDWSGLDALVAQFRPRVVVIDALPETTKAREFQARHPQGTVYLCYYPNQAVGGKTPEAAVANFDDGVINADRTRTLDETFADFYAGLATLPENFEAVADYAAQVKAPVRVLRTTSSGFQIATYVEAGADHYAHAENYCRIAARYAPTITEPGISWL